MQRNGAIRFAAARGLSLQAARVSPDLLAAGRERMLAAERKLAAHAVAAGLQVEMVAVNGVVVGTENTAENR